jgi:diamine N-acetyltransferase
MITIRKATTKDCETILNWENNPSLWEVTDEPGPFTMQDISTFLQEQNSLESASQERWIIEKSKSPIGMIDLFQWNRNEKSIGIGIALPNLESRRKGYAMEAMQIAHRTLRMKYNIIHFHCIIHPGNPASKNLFERLGYEKVKTDLHRNQLVNHYLKTLT